MLACSLEIAHRAQRGIVISMTERALKGSEREHDRRVDFGTCDVADPAHISPRTVVRACDCIRCGKLNKDFIEEATECRVDLLQPLDSFPTGGQLSRNNGRSRGHVTK
ncbi:hypothetical protein BN2476_300104 [Paraburkholderia piptadeniae]|uniref:Uncharacterized protein n=1 Tax=Paraburkholderia piptadeniae TaxID=1701573 RepID=A0A1N7S2S9_9BURK|nr:hypothetical protein BN2476_300104 [Paraburkholderia piptadeniae]